MAKFNLLFLSFAILIDLAKNIACFRAKRKKITK